VEIQATRKTENANEPAVDVYAGGLLDFLQITGVRLPIVDLASETDRSWLLAQVRCNLGDADLPYVAGSHSLE
jgi:hypothetical protein